MLGNKADPHRRFISLFFFFNDTATTEIYTLSLHDALPISELMTVLLILGVMDLRAMAAVTTAITARSEEHTSELQSRLHLVCRLLLEKKTTSLLCTFTCAEPNVLTT